MQEEELIISIIRSLKENEELTLKRNEKGKIKWVKKSTKGGELNLRQDSNVV